MENSYVLQLSDSKFKDLMLCFCGYAQCSSRHYFGPAARPNYLIHYILSGKGVYQVGEKRHELQAGQGFLIEPEVLTFYQADKDDPWTYCWIGFGGTRAEEYVRDIGLNSNHLIFQSENGKELKKIILNMMKLKEMNISNQYRLQSLLYDFFAVLTQDAVVDGSEEESKESIYISHAIQYIRNHYADDLKVVDIANYVCIDRSYLYKLFEKTLQMSPRDFLIRFRISRGKELLTITERSVEEIAAACGYKDFRAFSKVFKKLIGMSPSKYRTEHREEVRKRLYAAEQNLDELMKDENLLHLKQK